MRISGITYVPRKTRKARSVRNFFMVIFILALAAAVTITAISAYVGWNLTHPSKKPVASFSSNIVPEFTNVDFPDINNNLRLKGWFFPKKGSVKTIILAHGYKQNRLQFGEKTLDMIKSFLDKGYNVLAFDFRNCGISDGNLTSVGVYEKDDLLGAVKYVRAAGSKHVVLMGFSMGASASLVAAGDIDKSQGVDAVIADSPFADLKEYIAESLQVWTPLPRIPFNFTVPLTIRAITGINPNEASPREVIRNFAPKPVLLIHSTDDKAIPVENSRELYSVYSKAAKGKAVYWETSGAGHVEAYEANPGIYMEKVFEFLDKVFEQPAG